MSDQAALTPVPVVALRIGSVYPKTLDGRDRQALAQAMAARSVADQEQVLLGGCLVNPGTYLERDYVTALLRGMGAQVRAQGTVPAKDRLDWAVGLLDRMADYIEQVTV